MVAWFIVVAIAVAVAALSHKPDALSDYDNPTAEAGRPIPVPFGTITIKGLNNLGFWDKSVRTYKTKA
jgi:hypothetical protein